MKYLIAILLVSLVNVTVKPVKMVDYDTIGEEEHIPGVPAEGDEDCEQYHNINDERCTDIEGLKILTIPGCKYFLNCTERDAEKSSWLSPDVYECPGSMYFDVLTNPEGRCVDTISDPKYCELQCDGVQYYPIGPYYYADCKHVSVQKNSFIVRNGAKIHFHNVSFSEALRNNVTKPQAEKE